MNLPFFKLQYASFPLIAFAIHDGHAVRPELASLYNLSEGERLREEDPFTGEFAKVSPCRVVGMRSRFETDLNRPPEKAVYRKPEDAWGLNVWKGELSESAVDRSMSLYRDFYANTLTLISQAIDRYGFAVVYDIHSYNHRRESPDKIADPDENPEVNLGTENNNRYLWQPVIDRFAATMRRGEYDGRNLDIRENVKFQGGYLSKWINNTFGDRCLTISIEFKKIFMDEWNGEGYKDRIKSIKKILANTVEPTLDMAKGLIKKEAVWEMP